MMPIACLPTKFSKQEFTLQLGGFEHMVILSLSCYICNFLYISLASKVNMFNYHLIITPTNNLSDCKVCYNLHCHQNVTLDQTKGLYFN